MSKIRLAHAYTIQKIEAEPYDQVIAFVMKIRKEVFPMLSTEQLPQDLDQFEQYYVLRKKCCCFCCYIRGWFSAWYNRNLSLRWKAETD